MSGTPSTYRALYHLGNPHQGYYTDFDAADAGEAGWNAAQFAASMASHGEAPSLVSVTQLPAGADPAPEPPPGT